MLMASSQIILENLKNHDQYLTKFHETQQSTYFEQLIAEVFSHVFYLPLYTSDNDNNSIPHRVIWLGKNNPISKAPGGGPDAVAHCYNFHLIIEATRKTGTRQWSQEFAQSIEHCKDFCNETGIQKKDVVTLMICTNLHRYTYRSIKSNPRQEYKLVPIKVLDLVKILQTSILAFTLRHLELRKLLNQIYNCIRDSSSVQNFSDSVDSITTRWQKDVLKLEKSVFICVKSYEAMRKIVRTHGRIHIGVSEILQKLQGHPIVKQYFDIIGEVIMSDTIEDSLVQQSFASRIGLTYDGEEIFEPVPRVDFEGRSLRLINVVKGIK